MDMDGKGVQPRDFRGFQPIFVGSLMVARAGDQGRKDTADRRTPTREDTLRRAVELRQPFRIFESMVFAIVLHKKRR